METKINLNNSIFNFNIEKPASTTLVDGFRTFLNKSLEYKTQFLQKKYANAYDGYSYLGQTDSLNQYSDDLLHSFVLSEFTDKNSFPQEFQSFLNNEFGVISQSIKAVEIKILNDNGLHDLAKAYKNHFGHMISCNYYPKISTHFKAEKRLTAHKDVSLFSVFPYGVAEGFVYNDEKEVRLGAVDKCFAFKGFGLDYFTNGKYKGLNHYVELPKTRLEERFSVAFFSIPKPNAIFTIEGKTYNSETFYQDYLNLF